MSTTRLAAAPDPSAAFGRGASIRRLSGWVSSALLAVLASACQPPSESDRQRIDAAVEKTQEKSGELAADVKRVADKAGTAVVRTGRDFAITAEVKAGLARDPALGAEAIDVDTEAGRVQLTGYAPDEAARIRAVSIAGAIQGVASVDNQLQGKTVN